MFSKKEVLVIIAAAVILAFSISFFQDLQTIINPMTFLWMLLIVFVILAVNIFVKKFAAYYYESEIEMKFFEFQRYGFKPGQHLNKPFPIGVILPLISKIIFFPLKNLVWMASLVFDIKPKSFRAARRHELYSFSEMTEFHIGIIAASGIIANLICAVIGYFLGFSDFARISTYFCLFNMLPLGELDGNKIFFGNIVLWSFLASLVVIGILFAIFIV